MVLITILGQEPAVIISKEEDTTAVGVSWLLCIPAKVAAWRPLRRQSSWNRPAAAGRGYYHYPRHRVRYKEVLKGVHKEVHKGVHKEV
jgi:hypothetical protein